MATIQRQVFIGQPEPSPLSLRVPIRQETRLTISFRNQSGVPIGVDLGSNLELAGRSGAAPNLFYNLTTTDITDGRAQVIIPAGDLVDPNGYNLMLRGYLSGDPMMFARGSIAMQDVGLMGALGLPGAGEGGAVPFIERIDLVLPRGTVANLFTSVWADESATTPVDLTDLILTANIFTSPGGAVIDHFTIVPGPSAHTVWLSLTVAQLDDLPNGSWWTLVGVPPTGLGVRTFCEGSVTVFGEVTTP